MNWLDRLNNGAKNLGDGLEVLHWAYSPALLDNVTHRHTYFEICLVGDYGAGVFTVEGEPHALAPGDLFIARPGVAHRIQNTGARAMELFWVCFSHHAASAPRHPNTHPTPPSNDLWREFSDSLSLVVPDCVGARSLWETLRSFAQNSGWVGHELQLAALSKALLLEIARLGAPDLGRETPVATDPHRAARLAARYINDNLARKISVEEIAAHVHLSPRHLERRFAQFAGVSPSGFIETTRLERARALLRSSDRSVKEIAALCGYANVHYFTRAFSRHMGTTPAAFRRTGVLPHKSAPKIGQLV